LIDVTLKRVGVDRAVVTLVVHPIVIVIRVTGVA
jgi:hypothetical protein